MNKAIFIDKDGTLIDDVPYNVNPKLIHVQKYVESLSRLQEDGYKLVIVSNQPGVALGYFKEKELKGVKEQIDHLLEDKHVFIEGFYYCPHSPESQCNCRKPRPGLIIKAASDLNVDLEKSWMIGDILNDVEAGRRSGCRTILIDNGNETEWVAGKERMPHFIARHLKEATDIILHNGGI